MASWLNPTLDRAAAAATFKANRQVRVSNLLAEDKAASVLQGLSQIGEWSMVCASSSGVAIIPAAELSTMAPEKQATLQASLAESARQGLGFAFLSYRMDDRWKGGAPDTALGAFYSALMSDEIRSLVSDITGASDLNGVAAQVTRFGPSHYLTRHKDEHTPAKRQVAFIWGFTPQWHPDWGGLLQFFTDAGTPTIAYAPGFNTLDLIAVDQVRSTTFVTPFAGAVRQAINGWYVADPAALDAPAQT
ncbi:MAG: 2OG-Fe(II) oxygenase family protein [Pseudomonadota bacterium]